MFNQPANKPKKHNLILLLGLILAACTLSACESNSTEDAAVQDEQTPDESTQQDGIPQEEPTQDHLTEDELTKNEPAQNTHARKNLPNNENGIVIKDDSQVVATNTTMTLSTTFMNVPDGFLNATIMGGWVFPNDDSKFGDITVRLDMIDTPGKPAETGKYTLVEDLANADVKSKFAALKLEDTTLNDGPRRVIATSGTLELESVTYDQNKVTGISIQYDGTFRNADNPNDKKQYELSGSIIVEDQ